MKIIAITQEDFFDEEAETICFLLDKGGIDTLHLRKPAATSDNLQSLLQHIPSQYYRHIILHEHFELIHKFPLKGFISIVEIPIRLLVIKDIQDVHAIR